MAVAVGSLTIGTILFQILPAIIIPNIGGIIGAVLIKDDITKWYEKLKRPSWRPPNWVFGPMWTTLYILMGIASWMVYRDGGGFSGAACTPLGLYAVNLFLNWIWSPIFFRAHRPDLALVDIGILWVNILACIVTFYRVNSTAGLLMVPYLAWVSLATALNHYIWKNNPNAHKIR